ncbi:MAG: phospho-sugar mutase [Oscillospiraceae bacterium]|nr:phospho-sugar mutase [Oscillospiraceae bacterium]
MGHDAALRYEAFRQDLSFGTGGLRAEMGAGCNRMNLFTVAKATMGLARHLKAAALEPPSVCIAYDTRNHSRLFAECAARVLCAEGIRVRIFKEARPTPMLSYAVREAKAAAGIVVTASHNPKEYNGYKVYGATGGQLTDANAHTTEKHIAQTDVFAAYEAYAGMPLARAEAAGLLVWLGENTDEAYLAAIERHLPRRDYSRANGAALRMIYTPLHGCGLVPVTKMLDRLGYPHCIVVPEQADGDGNFPTVAKPNPEEKAAFAYALDWAKKENPDVIFATDPDADRIGVVARSGAGEYEVLTGTQTAALLCDYLIRTAEEQGKAPSDYGVITTIVTGTLGARICAAKNVHVENVLTGFKYIGEAMDRWQAAGKPAFLLGYEESYGYLTGDATRDKDAVISAALVAEMALYYKKEHGATLYQTLEQLYATYGAVADGLYNHEAKGAAGQAEIAHIMARLRAGWQTAIPGETIVRAEDYNEPVAPHDPSCTQSRYGLPLSDVVKLYLAGGEWLVLRPSGTEPKIKLYCCTDAAFAPGTAQEQAELRCAELLAKAAKALFAAGAFPPGGVQ